MRESDIIRTIVIMLATWLVTACNMLPVTDRPPVVPVEPQADCDCSQSQTSLMFATEAEIKEIQARLILLGYPTGDIDGIVGNATRNAIKAYQAEHKLLTDGRPSTELLAHIKAIVGNRQTPTISYPGL